MQFKRCICVFFVRFIFPENKGRFVEFSFLRNEEKRIYVKKN